MRAWIASSILALVATAPVSAQELPPEGEPELLVPAGPAPSVDGRIDEKEWEGAATFDVRRGEEVLGKARVRRTGRQLYFAFDTTLAPWGLGMRLMFTDPVSGRNNLVLVTPVDPPRSPVAAFRTLVGRDAQRVPSAACDVHFELAGREGFSCELRIPLDMLEIVPAEKLYAFYLEIWGLGEERTIAVYPQDERTLTTQARPAVFRSEGAWGARDAAADPSPPNEALVLLEDVDSVSEDGPYFPRDAGWIDGRRKDAALAVFEERAERAAASCPDVISVRTFLVQTKIARNDFEGALEALDALGAYLPPLSKTAFHLLIRSQILRDLGRYDEALAVLADHAEDLKGNAAADREKSALEGLREAWRVEQEILKGEAQRDDLPRVRLKTSKGDIDIELYEDDSPNGVANFIALVESGFYDGTRFHWSDGGGRIVGGDPNSRDDDPHNDGYGDPGYMIESEPGRRQTFPMTVGLVDKRRHRRTEGSTFAIHLSPFPMADGVNTVLGRVVAGEDVVRRIEHYDTIEKATVLRKRGHPYVPVKR